MIFRFLICIVSVVSIFASAKDLGFRYREGKCVNESGVEGYNTSFLGQCADLSNVTLSNLNLDDSDLSGSKFAGADLQNSTFRNANVSGCNFQEANLSGVEMTGAVIHSAKFNKAILVNIKLADSDIKNVDFSGANLSEVLLSYSMIENSVFVKTNFSKAVLDHSDFQSANMEQAIFAKAVLSEANLTRAKLAGAEFSNADLIGATLDGVDATGADFKSAILRSASMKNAVFKSAQFVGAKLESVKLNNSVMEKSDLRGATLKDARFDGASFKEALYNKRTILPFEKSQADDLGMVFFAKTGKIVVWDYFTDKGGEGQNTSDAIKEGLPEVKSEDIMEMNTLDAASVIRELEDSSVFLIPEMELGTDATFAASLKEVLPKFVETGGTVISMSDEYNFLGETGLLTAVFSNTRSEGTADVLLKDHPLAEGLGLQIEMTNSVAELDLNDSAAVSVIGEENESKLTYKKLGEGNVIHIGYDFYEYNLDATKILANAIKMGIE